MSLNSEWEKLANLQRPQEEQKAYWESYFDKETKLYEKILERADKPYKGKLVDVAAELGVEPVTMIGFIDGANTSFKSDEYDLESLSEDGEISLEMDLEKLFYNMLDAKADWLYGLKQWDTLLTKERRDEIHKQFKKDSIYIADAKPQRNEPCPCGSGRKYKQCHGKPGAEPLPAKA